MIAMTYSGGFFDRLWQLSGGDPVLFWIPCGLMAVAGIAMVLLVVDLVREGLRTRREERRAVACKLQAELDRRFGRSCARPVEVARGEWGWNDVRQGGRAGVETR